VSTPSRPGHAWRRTEALPRHSTHVEDLPQPESSVNDPAARPIAVVPGTLYLLGGVVPVRGDVNWLPDGRRGYESINAYLAVEPDRALFVDTGVALHREAIIAQARAVLEPARPVEVFLTRAEADAAGNLGELIREFDIRRAYTGGRSNPFDFFEEASAGAPLEMRRVATAVPGQTNSGEPIRLGANRSVISITPALRLLSTSWAYDSGTRALFTSDTFGQVGMDAPDDSAFVDVTAKDEDRGMTREWLLTKFDWLVGARLSSIRASIARLAAELDVELVLPTHGRIIRGRAAVRSHFDQLLALLEEFDGERNGSHGH
jgi:flavorubredoxin